jgi:hypothetical protein
MPSRRFLRSGRALSKPQCSAGVIARKAAFPKGLAHIDHEKVVIGPEFSSKGARLGQGRHKVCEASEPIRGHRSIRCQLSRAELQVCPLPAFPRLGLQAIAVP